MEQTYTVTVDEFGNTFWYNEQFQIHRAGGLPAIEYVDGSKFWYANNKQHREGDLPAVELCNGRKEWYVNGKRHRVGGLPAIEYTNGDKSWYVNGEPLTEEQANIIFNKCDISSKVIEICREKSKLVEV